ncbi:MAG: hypothetical protein IPH07_25800 [Deltaproteobacteria bacterium]|nr:hypothetical protein [Deltaproteobacteria bacterium]MBK8240545.1 hypothetical protein [Deltaproteobacteria bacterium]MBP7291963.1 hypothetical protein [Nannocystaceae bacterium]
MAANSDIDAGRFPHLAAYVAVLPQGLDSYTECRSRATLVTSALEGHDIGALAAALPEPLRDLAEHPPLPGAWVPAAHSDALFHALVDLHYPTLEAMLAWTRQRTHRTARSRMYRALTRMTGPKMVLKTSAVVHGMFQRGTHLTATPSEGGLLLRLEHPPYLHYGWNHHSNVGMFEVLVEIAAGAPGRVALLDSQPGFALYSAHWHELG